MIYFVFWLFCALTSFVCSNKWNPSSSSSWLCALSAWDLDIGLQGFLRYQGSRSGSRSRSGRVFGLVRSGYGSGTRSRSGRVFAIWSNAQQWPMEILSGATSGIFIGGASMQGKGSVHKKRQLDNWWPDGLQLEVRAGKVLNFCICIFVYLCTQPLLRNNILPSSPTQLLSIHSTQPTSRFSTIWHI